MNPISKILASNFESHSRFVLTTALPALTQLFETALICALTPVLPAGSAHLFKRYEGGVDLPTIDFDTLVHPAREAGPTLSPALQCALKRCNLQDVCSTKEQIVASLAHYADRVDARFKGLRSYLNEADSLAPVHALPKTRFPENFSAFLKNGRVLIGNGKSDCAIDANLDHYKKCETASRYLEKAIVESNMESVIYSEESFRGGGFGMGLPMDDGSVLKAYFGLNPQRHASYVEALKKVEADWLQNPCFFEQSEEEIIASFMAVHELTLEGVVGESDAFDVEAQKDGYRTKMSLVRREAANEGIEPMLEMLKKMGGTEKDAAIYLNSIYRLRGQDVTDLRKALTKAELAVWEKINFIPPLPEEIPGLMKGFVTKLKEYLAADRHPIAVGAWAHCELGRIHPFADGNGRLARILMNAIFVRGGFEPVIIPDDEHYSYAVNRDEKERGYFAKYIVSLIESQAKDMPVFIPAAQ